MAPIWPTGRVTFYVNTDTSAYGGSLTEKVTSAQFLAAFNAAAATWNNLCNSKITVVTGGTTTSVRNASDLVNTVSYDNRTTAGGNAFASSSMVAWAVPTLSMVSGNYQWTDCDIQVNGEMAYTLGTSGTTDLDLQSIFTHEIGHCLGLDHTYGTNYNSATYWTTNSTLLNSVMRGSSTLQSIEQRTLSQDDIDGMQCLYPSSGTYRYGSYCSSYHGTNGGAAISGLVNGGAASTRSCGSGMNSGFTTNGETGGGCISSAIAEDGSGRTPTTDTGLIFALLFPLVIWVFRKFRAWAGAFFAVGFFFVHPAMAAVEIGYDYFKSSPSLVNRATSISSGDGSFSYTGSTSKKTKYSSLNAFYGAISMESADSSTGLYYRSNVAQTVSLQGYDLANTLQLTKVSKLEGWSAGVASRWYLNFSVDPSGAEGRSTKFFFELQLGIGQSNFSQTITNSNGFGAGNGDSSVSAAAWVLETNAFLGTRIPIWELLDAALKVGYARQRSTAYVVSSASGTRFSGVNPGERLSLQEGQDARLSRGGLGGTVSLVAVF
ncbi:MAG: matrixin family metalloprotease [Bacteriovoracia bacterium]